MQHGNATFKIGAKFDKLPKLDFGKSEFPSGDVLQNSTKVAFSLHTKITKSDVSRTLLPKVHSGTPKRRPKRPRESHRAHIAEETLAVQTEAQSLDLDLTFGAFFRLVGV